MKTKIMIFPVQARKIYNFCPGRITKWDTVTGGAQKWFATTIKPIKPVWSPEN